MATYKVIQDIEAEDKLLGPLTLRQFIYAVIVVVLGFIMFRLFFVQPLLALPFLPPALLFAVLAAPFGHDQSSEVWLLAKIRFFLKPRTRIWNQSGLQELVTITAPKKIEQVLTNGLNEYQVKSRLEALAQTIDTRGWAVKGMDINMFQSPAYATEQPSSDRLLTPESVSVPQVPDLDVTVNDDIFDYQNNPVAQHMTQLTQASSQAHRQQIVQQMNQIRTAQQHPAPVAQSAPAYQAPQQSYPMPQPQTVSKAEEDALLSKIHKQKKEVKGLAYGHTRILPTPEEQAKTTAEAVKKNAASEVTDTQKADTLNYVNRDDLTVATISRQVNKKQPPEDEVVVSLR